MSTGGPTSTRAPGRNPLFLTEKFAHDHIAAVDSQPLVPRYELSYLGQALSGTRQVLDVGCGGAQLADLLREMDPSITYVGLDSSPALLARATLRPAVQGLVRGEAKELPFPTDAFDLVYQRDVLMHHPRPFRMLEEMYRVGRRVLFNARMSPFLASVLTLHDETGSVTYQILPYDGLFDFLASLSPSPSRVTFRFVDRIGTNPERFAWSAVPHYTLALGGGVQFDLHCLVEKGASDVRTQFVDETPEPRLNPRSYLFNLHPLRRRLRRLLFQVLGPARFYTLRQRIRAARAAGGR